ncbi:MAG: hypothetical protein JSR33_11325 [Proteobacteria bacterium]|nr:hypothetical protein [Pseudomonadota bacterium]
MSQFDQALLDPTSIYKQPMDVVSDDSLTRDQKIQVLHRWEYDARELQVAEEENMPDLSKEQRTSMLSRVLDALHSLGASADHNIGFNKQG